MDSNPKLFNSIMSINKVIKYKMNGFIFIETTLLKEKNLYSKIYVCLKILKKQVIVLIFEEKNCEMSAFSQVKEVEVCIISTFISSKDR